MGSRRRAGRLNRAAAAIFGAAAAISLAAAGARDASGTAGNASGAEITALTVDNTGFTVDLALPAPVLSTFVSPARGKCTRLELPGIDTGLGLPALAAYGWLVGVPGALAAAGPPDVMTAAGGAPGEAGSLGASVDILSLAERDLVVDSLCGAPTDSLDGAGGALRRVDWEVDQRSVDRVGDESGRTPLLPALDVPAVSLEAAGVLRHQPVARLVVRPVARASARLLRVRTHVRLRVRYSDPASIDRAPAEPGPFGALMQGLLNHAFLPRWRAVDPSPAAAPPAASPGASDPLRADPPGPSTGRLSSTGQAAIGPAADPTALKLIVDRDGPAIVTGADLVRAGWDLAELDPGTLSLEAGGRPVALALDGTADGRFDPPDRLLFHGRAMTGLYTRENVYWLRSGGTPTRIAARDGRPDAGAPAVRSFDTTLHLEQDSEYFISMRAGEGDDRWMWGSWLSAQVQPPRSVFTATFGLSNLGPDPASARLRLRLQGYAHDPRVAPDHHVQVRINGTLVADTRFDGAGMHVVEADVDPGRLIAGTNTLSVTALGDTGAAVDSVFVNWIEIEHAAGYRVVGDRLDFAAPSAGRHAFTLTGFSAPEVRVIDVTDPEQPVELLGIAVDVADDGSYRVRFSDTAAPGTRYTAFTPGGTVRPVRIVRNAASDWRDAGRGADYIIITHPDFADAIAPLAAHHAAQGLRVATVMIDDVYDEFAAGVFDPPAIRAFLKHAFEHWAAPAPTYVLLVGEANLDYRRGYNQGPPNYVPSVQFDTTSSLTGDMGAATSDLWFAALAGEDDLPEVLLGRISVSTAAQAETVVDKILRYKSAPPAAEWRRRIILVADDDGAALFEPFSEELAALLPAGAMAERFYAARYPRDRNLAADIGVAIDTGALAVNFTGHGNVELWSPWPGGGRIFENADIRRLTNAERLPLFTAATCMNGWIDHPLRPVSMAELWLTQAGGGGVAAWSPSGLATLSAQRQLLPSLYRGLHDGRGLPIGALTAEASLQAYAQSADWSDIIRMFVLLGDPALVISGVPIRPAPTETSSPTSPPNPTPLPSPSLPGDRIFLPLAEDGRDG